MKSLHYFIILFLCSGIMVAQQLKITGTVTDKSDGLPLPGVNVIVKGTTTSTQTDFDGNYELMTIIGDKIQFSYIGFENHETEVKKETYVYDVSLIEDLSELDEVVVVGYGTRKKSSITSSVSSVRGAEIAKYETPRMESALEGKSAGVSIKIRGAASVSHESKSHSDSPRGNDPAYGQLTAGEINDLEKWSEFKKIYKKGEAYDVAKRWGFDHTNKIVIMVKNKDESPAVNAAVTLSKNNNKVITGRTDINGSVVLFKGAYKKSDKYIVQVGQHTNSIIRSISYSQKHVSVKVKDPIKVSNDIDVMFTVDATGSMADEIQYLKSELKNIMGRIDQGIEQKRVAFTFYRDHGDQYVTKHQDFKANIDKSKVFLSAQSADGGGDYEEAVEEAFKVSLAQSWNTEAKARIMFLLLDAPPHLTKDNVAVIKAQISKAQEKGIRIIPVVASGANKEVEFLMRSFSVATNGTYVFLTDDSGIGNDHIEATTKSFKLEKLNDLIVRLIKKYAGITKKNSLAHK